MKTTLTTAALLAALATAPATAGAAAPGYYEGKTDGGQKISFKISKSGAVSAIDGLVPTSCVNTVGKPPRAGAELFKPPGTYRVGATRKTQVLQESAMHYNDVTKNYAVTLKKTRRGGLKATLELNFSYQSLDYSGWDGPRLEGWVCQGNDTFSVR